MPISAVPPAPLSASALATDAPPAASSVLAARMAAAVEAMPAFAHSVRRVVELAQDSACPPRALVEVIRTDPVLTVKVLRVVNSSYYALARPVSSIDQAVVFLGIHAIKNLALGVATIGLLPSHGEGGFDAAAYLDHSLTCAVLARALAERTPGADPNDAFLAGLLHDFGKVVLAHHLPQDFARACEMSAWQQRALGACLHEVVGFSPAEVGAQLVEKWRFAPALVHTLRHLHQPQCDDTPLTACVFAANALAQRLGHTFGGYWADPPWPASVAARLGASMQDAQAQLSDVNALLAASSELLALSRALG